MSAKATAYSYVRFSNPQQAGGDSVARQAELRDAFAHSATGAVDLVTVSTRPGRRPEFQQSLRLCCELTDDELPKAGIRFRPPARCA